MPFASPNDFHQLAEFFEANLFQGQNNTRRRVQVLDEWSVDEIHRTFLKEKLDMKIVKATQGIHFVSLIIRPFLFLIGVESISSFWSGDV